MKKTTYALLILFICSFAAKAQNVTGKWKTIDDETGEARSIVEIYEQDGKVYGKIVEILLKNKKEATCVDCPGEDKGKPIKGLEIIKGLEKDDDEWADGKILDPTTGKLYKCYIALENPDKLKVRGYIGISLLGRTQYWTRVN